MKTSIIICSTLVIMLSLTDLSSRVGAAPVAGQGVQAPTDKLEESLLPI